MFYYAPSAVVVQARRSNQPESADSSHELEKQNAHIPAKKWSVSL